MLFHYVVEGTSVKDSSKVPPDVSLTFKSIQTIPYIYVYLLSPLFYFTHASSLIISWEGFANVRILVAER